MSFQSFLTESATPVQVLVMRISDDERRAIRQVLDIAEQYGYGNVIAHLKTSWARNLMAVGLTEDSARLGADTGGYPFAMQDDLIERGEWDTTGKKYSA